jgi:iron complex transport system ATP-binding protein
MMLRVNGVAFDYRTKPVLKEITFQVRQNELLAILGPNGVGKTTLLKCMNAIFKPKKGEILIENEDVLKLDPLQIAHRIAYVSQHSEATRTTAFDAILLGRKPYIRFHATDHDLKIVNAVIRKLNLNHLALRYINEMSGGELQKICIARALVQEPKILLLDEPTSSLDLKNQLEILRIIHEIVKGHPMSAVMTMHNLNMALRYADRFLFLKDGLVFAAGERDAVTAEMINAVYGVRVEIERYHGYPIVIPVD